MTLQSAPTVPHAATHRGHRHPWRALLVRLHFFAGVITAPLIILACLSGLAYAVMPKVERIVYADQLVAEPNGRLPLPMQDQMGLAINAMPRLVLNSFRATHAPDETTRFDFADPSLDDPMAQRSVYIDPYTGAVRGTLVTRHGTTPLTSWIGTLHGDLHLGTVGRVYSELASHWLVVLVVGGFVVWWQRVASHRQRRWRHLLVPEHGPKGLHRSTSWHSVTGVWAGIVALALALSGLTIALSAGPKWTSLLGSLNATAPRLSASLSTAGTPGGAPTAPPAAANSGHAGHAGGPSAAMAGVLPYGFGADEILAAAGRAGVTESVTLTRPKAPGMGWTATEGDLSWPVNLDSAVIDPSTGEIVRTLAWTDWPVLAQFNRLFLFFHFGRTFGGVNQIVLIVTMLALTFSAVWGYRMWWLRRPHGASALRFGKAPHRGGWRDAPRAGVLAGSLVLVAWGVLMPVFGISLAAFLLVDALVALRHRRSATTPGHA